MQTLEDAQDTNRRMNRRLGAIEAPLHTLVSKAFDQVRESQQLAERALGRSAADQMTIQWQRGEIDRHKKRADERQSALLVWRLSTFVAIVVAAVAWLR